MVCWLVCWLDGFLVGWLVDWLVGWLVDGWLVGRMVQLVCRNFLKERKIPLQSSYLGTRLFVGSPTFWAWTSYTVNRYVIEVLHTGRDG